MTSHVFAARRGAASRLLAVPLAATLLGGCATPAEQGAGGGAPVPAPTGSTAAPADPVAARVAALLAGWRSGPGTAAWREGFVPLQGLSIPPANVTFTPATQVAFDNGWYRLQGGLPEMAVEPQATVTFHAGGTLRLPALDAAGAFAQLAAGTAPDPCPGFDKAARPEKATPAPCRPLTVTGARYDRVDLRTSRGTASVPAWLFAVRELGGEVARVAIDQAAVATVPDVPTEPPPPQLMPVERVLSVAGATVTYEVGGSACDRDVRATVTQEADAVVLGATATRGTGMCTRQLVLRQLTTTLRAPVAGRALLDTFSGRLLTPLRRAD